MPPSLASSLSRSLPCAKQLCSAAQSSRSFSTTFRQEQRLTRARKGLFMWLASQGEKLRNPLEGSTNYLGAYTKDGKLKRVIDASRGTEDPAKKGEDKGRSRGRNKQSKSVDLPPEKQRDRVPYPLNTQFVSESVLSEPFRHEIWKRIMEEGKSVREVSVELKVEMSRVGAVVRLMEVEMEWKRIGKPLMRPYAKAVMKMLPQSKYYGPGHDLYLPDSDLSAHESINDLPVHASTGKQIFHPTSESRHFTRADAAKVFHEKLLPADDRIPHPELVIQHREFLSGMSEQERIEANKAREAIAAAQRQKVAARQASHEHNVLKVDKGRWQFRFTPINVDAAGKDGRGHKGVGWRYGVPHDDRDRAKIKIPMSVS